MRARIIACEMETVDVDEKKLLISLKPSSVRRAPCLMMLISLR
jgi:hypothetical protein